MHGRTAAARCHCPADSLALVRRALLSGHCTSLFRATERQTGTVNIYRRQWAGHCLTATLMLSHPLTHPTYPSWSRCVAEAPAWWPPRCWLPYLRHGAGHWGIGGGLTGQSTYPSPPPNPQTCSHRWGSRILIGRPPWCLLLYIIFHYYALTPRARCVTPSLLPPVCACCLGLCRVMLPSFPPASLPGSPPPPAPRVWNVPRRTVRGYSCG